MVPDEFHEFFVASAGSAAALVGLLFVAVSVAAERSDGVDLAVPLQVRASAALVAFNNVLLVSLFALIPTDRVGWAASVIGGSGVVFTLASTRRLLAAGGRRLQSVLLLVALLIVFASEIYQAINLIGHPHDPSRLGSLAVTLVVCLAIGIARAWGLVGLRDTGLFSSVRTIVHREPDHGTES